MATGAEAQRAASRPAALTGPGTEQGLRKGALSSAVPLPPPSAPPRLSWASCICGLRVERRFRLGAARGPGRRRAVLPVFQQLNKTDSMTSCGSSGLLPAWPRAHTAGRTASERGSASRNSGGLAVCRKRAKKNQRWKPGGELQALGCSLNASPRAVLGTHSPEP